jgi:hypothetical protein
MKKVNKGKVDSVLDEHLKSSNFVIWSEKMTEGLIRVSKDLSHLGEDLRRLQQSCNHNFSVLLEILENGKEKGKKEEEEDSEEECYAVCSENLKSGRVVYYGGLVFNRKKGATDEEIWTPNPDKAERLKKWEITASLSDENWSGPEGTDWGPMEVRKLSSDESSNGIWYDPKVETEWEDGECHSYAKVKKAKPKKKDELDEDFEDELDEDFEDDDDWDDEVEKRKVGKKAKPRRSK